MRPRIGITARSSEPAAIQRLHWYIESVQRAGGEPLILAPDDQRPDLARLDGLLLSGGGDIHPRWYGQPLAGTEVSAIDEARDEMEITLTKAALEADIPILAICRGIQVLNVAMGGALIQDLGDGHRTPDEAYKHHLIWVVPGTLMAATLGISGQVAVNTYHHQGIRADMLAPGLIASAQALPERWLIEGVESPDHRFVLGVQWHPERYREVPHLHQRLFQALVRAAAD
ncbi:MAG TPA: gamma-glutamyl-gamma-aminobutyrate hydrolase family protein [Caldilineae bacterium]|nr:gamma-glutamyl-gamma-aminobutyrate hydrolase family protein [Caldilineae bacterium]